VWETTARFYEAVESLRPILARREELSAPVRVALLNEAGRFFRYGGDSKEALLKLHEEALSEAYLLEDVHLLLDTLDVYAISANEGGEIALAAKLWSEAIELARNEAPLLRLGHLLNNAATSYTMMGQPDRATVLLEESLTIARKAEGIDRIFGALTNLSNAARLAGNANQDHAYLTEAIALAETTKNHTMRIVFLSAAAESALYHKDYPMSALLHSALQAICQQVNMAWPLRYQQEFARYMTQTQAHIDEAIYPRLIQQGARFTLDQAIERVAIWLEEGRRTVDGGRTKG
jgi:tetratricopeptide (TPR) repeat protein